MALAQLGWLEFEAGRARAPTPRLIQEGRAKLNRAVQLDPKDYAVRLYLGTVLLQEDGNAAGAVAQYQQFLADGPPADLVKQADPELREAYQKAGVPAAHRAGRLSVNDPGVGDDGRSQWERMVAGDLYRADDPQIVAAHHRAMGLLERYNRTPADGTDRTDLLVELLAAFGPDSCVRPPFLCDYGSQISIGARTFVNFGLVALDPGTITIGSDVQIGPNVQLLTATHPLDADLRRSKWEGAHPVVVADNVWLGGGVIVLPGVTIGENTVVGAGAVVTRDLPADVVAVGNPARVIRRAG